MSFTAEQLLDFIDKTTYLDMLALDVRSLTESKRKRQAPTYLIINDDEQSLENIKKAIKIATNLPVRAFGKTSSGTMTQKIDALMQETERSVWLINLDGMTHNDQWKFFGLTGYCSTEGKRLRGPDHSCDQQLVVFLTSNIKKVLPRIRERMEINTYSSKTRTILNNRTKSVVITPPVTLDWMIG